MSVSFLLRIAALVLFIVAALLGFGVGDVSLPTIVGVVSVGLACWVASSLDWPAVRPVARP
jgi:hypothetical protein